MHSIGVLRVDPIIVNISDSMRNANNDNKKKTKTVNEAKNKRQIQNRIIIFFLFAPLNCIADERKQNEDAIPTPFIAFAV